MAKIFITGATAGIGRATAILLANKGHTVIAAGRNAQALSQLAKQSPNLHPVSMDVSDPSSVSAAVAQAATILEGAAVDVLVNNAGFGAVGPLECIDDEAWLRQYETNVFGLVRVTRAFLPAMRERGRGRIVNISSVAGDVTMPFFAPYASSKHAVESISDALRNELFPHGIDVVLIKPGAVKTGFGAAEREQLDAFAEANPAYRQQLQTLMRFHRQLHAQGADPISVAGTIVTACECHKPRARYVTPRGRNTLFVLMKHWLPTRLSDWLIRRLSGLDRAHP